MSFAADSSIQEARPASFPYATALVVNALNKLSASEEYLGAKTNSGGGAVTERGVRYIRPASVGLQPPTQSLSISLNLQANDFLPVFTSSSGVDVWTAANVVSPVTGHTYTNTDCFSGYTGGAYTVQLCSAVVSA